MPNLRDALRDIALRAAGPLGISLQRAIDTHLSTFRAAIIHDGASHRALSLLLHEAGVHGVDGKAPPVGSISRALNRASAKREAAASTAAPPPKSRRRLVNTAPHAAANSDGIRGQTAKSNIRSAIEPGAARLPIPPPVDVSDSVSADALRRGRLLNVLRTNRS
jgi:hypothetical protein